MRGTITDLATVLHIDGARWHFVNGAWRGGDDSELLAPEDDWTDPGEGMQGMHWAFAPKLSHADCTVHCEINLRPHSDAGILLRATDASHFYLLHFPNCGQACRAQHFWAALSKMDDSGYLRHVKLEMVRRVPSQSNIWLPVEAKVKGSRFSVRIGDYGYFEAEDATFSGPGCLGVFAQGGGRIRNVRVEGNSATSSWCDEVSQPANWFHPIPSAQPVWQQPLDLKRFSDGELLLLFGAQGDRRQDEEAQSRPNLTRSTDGGHTWSPPEPLQLSYSGTSWSTARLHLTPRGHLIAMLPGREGNLRSVSTDRGCTWSEPVQTNLHLGPRMEKPVQHLSPQGFLNLADNGMLAFLLKGRDTLGNIWTWGAYHCQAFTSRSDDDGLTWSAPVNIDLPGVDAEGKPLDGNLDLTEASAVQLPGGRVLAYLRPVYSPWMWETWSDDGGRSWGPCVRGPFPGYAAPNMVRTASGALLITHRLPALTVNCSLDGGLIWDHGTTIDSGLWAMGSMVEVAPDVVLYLYWDTPESLMRGQFLRVTQDGLVPVRKE